jgi:hypothetical protein
MMSNVTSKSKSVFGNTIAEWARSGAKCVTVDSNRTSGFLYKNPLVDGGVDFNNSYTL